MLPIILWMQQPVNKRLPPVALDAWERVGWANFCGMLFFFFNLQGCCKYGCHEIGCGFSCMNLWESAEQTTKEYNISQHVPLNGQGLNS